MKYLRRYRIGLALVAVIALGSLCTCSKSSVAANQTPAPSNAQTEYRLPIIMYHSTHPKNPNKYNITPSQLEKDLEYIKESGYQTVVVADLIAFKEQGKPLPSKPIMLTFDDGYLNNYLNAYPLFVKHRMKCVMSVVGQLTDSNYKKGEKRHGNAHVDYDQIREMSQSGYIEIQNHTDLLHSQYINCDIKKRLETTEQYEQRLKNDILSLHEKLREKSGVECTAVAYPFGAYSKKLSATFLQDIGYNASFTCNERMNTITRSGTLFNLCRFNRPHGKTSAAYFNKIFKRT